MQEQPNAMASSSTIIPAGPASSQETKVDGPTARPKRTSKPPTTPSAKSTSTARHRPGYESSSSRKPKATFTTVRSYPEVAPVPLLHISVEEENLQRNQRKSKVQAINKMDKVGVPLTTDGPHATSFIPPAPPPAGPSMLRNPIHRPPIHNPPFDINTVRQEGPRHPPPRTEPRMFGLEECPTFYPTMEEFTDPMAYISSIGEEGRRYGIAKIVPPEGWRMPFTLPTDKFRFKTRLQRLNSLEAASRAKVNFLEQLSMFHKQQGNAKATIPIIERKTVDLWRLRKEVNKVGGVLTLDRTDGWADVTETMGYARYSAPHIKKAYKEVVQPFDEWSIRAKASLSQSPLAPYSDAASTRPPVFKDEPGSPTKKSRMSGMRSVARPSVDGLQPPIKIKLMTGLSKSASVPIKLESHAGPSSTSFPEILINGAAHPKTPTVKIRVPGFSSAGGDDSDLSSEASSPDPPTPPPLPKYVKGDVCEICRHGHAASKILLCDGCDRGEFLVSGQTEKQSDTQDSTSTA
jgi:histone demethylase JARID1